MWKAVHENVLKDDFLVDDEGLQSYEHHLNFHDQEYIGKIKELQFYLDTVEKVVKPGCSQELLNVALTSLSSLVKTLSIISSGPCLLASL